MFEDGQVPAGFTLITGLKETHKETRSGVRGEEGRWAFLCGSPITHTKKTEGCYHTADMTTQGAGEMPNAAGPFTTKLCI